ncbi:MAG: hypothetical protein Q9220_000032 [cf. Caloplaca sp. 1 TL-2023]
MAAAFTILSVGGPALLYYVQPTDEELFQANVNPDKKYNPELQKKSLENRHGRQQDFDDFVTKLKEYSKSDKPSAKALPKIWEVAAADEARTRANTAQEQRKVAAEIQKRRDDIKRQSIGGQ